MLTASLIYPHQLYSFHPAVDTQNLHVFVEETLFFGDERYPVRFHKQKLMLHRASMRHYIDNMMAGYNVLYLEYHQLTSPDSVFQLLAERSIQKIRVVDPTDYMLEKRIRRFCKRFDFDLEWLESPNFINSVSELNEFYANKTKYYHADFYEAQREKLGILVDNVGEPIGGKWSFDSENREKFKKSQQSVLPAHLAPLENQYVTEAREYVEKYFPDNPGTTAAFFYPIERKAALKLMQDFVAHKLDYFGTYQDAITTIDPFLFHSLLSSSINIGLLSPMEVTQYALAYYEEHDVRLASVEGFVRQLIGWREFMRAVYVLDGVTQRTSNFFDQSRTLDERWYTADTGILPIDDTIAKALKYAYAHHIERLMLLGNFMVLCEIHPDNVYRWFMEMFIDAYDWVMVPNVYGMSQYADGGLMTTKPYISASNYVRKMSSYGNGDWAPIWDGLYWRFIHKHLDFFQSNPRLSMMSSHLKRMSDEKWQSHLENANTFLHSIRLS